MQVQSIYHYYKEIIERYTNREPINTDLLGETLQELDNQYNEGLLTPLSDEEYDRLHQIYIELTGKIIIGGGGKEKIHHDYPKLKGTLKKVHYITAKEKAEDCNAIEGHKILYDWIQSTYTKLPKGTCWKLGFWPKYDGASIVLSLDENRKCVRAITRGQENVGVDKTNVFGGFEFRGIIPVEYNGKPVGLKTEVIMTKDNFKEYNEKYGNSSFVDERSALISILNSDNFTTLHHRYITIKPLMMEIEGKLVSFTEHDDFGPKFTLETSSHDLGFITPKEVEITIREMKEYIDTLSVKCDGVVVRWYDQEAMDTLGRDEENSVNLFEQAYKFPKPNNYTILRGITQDIGLLGKVSFTAFFDPIKINNKNIQHASLGGEDRMRSLRLAVGDMVNIKYEIIPYLCIDSHCEEHRSGRDPISVITHCPYCGEELERDPELCCKNLECPSRAQGKIYNFLLRMGIVGIGESIVELLYHFKIVTSIYDLWRLQEHKTEFLDVDGLGKKTYKSLKKQIEDLCVTEDKILASVSIPSIGPKKSKLILNKYYLTEILEKAEQDDEALFQDLMQIDGISSSTANKVIDGILQNMELLCFLMENVKIKKQSKEKKGVIVFTGFRNPDFESHLENMGYDISEGLTRTSSYLIALNPEDSNPSSKIKKAKAYNIPILSLAEAYEYFEFKK